MVRSRGAGSGGGGELSRVCAPENGGVLWADSRYMGLELSRQDLGRDGNRGPRHRGLQGRSARRGVPVRGRIPRTPAFEGYAGAEESTACQGGVLGEAVGKHGVHNLPEAKAKSMSGWTGRSRMPGLEGAVGGEIRGSGA